MVLTHYQSIATDLLALEVLCMMKVFKSYLHNMYTELRNKVALSTQDDKRYIVNNSVNTLAWGHVNIEINQNLNSLILGMEEYINCIS